MSVWVRCESISGGVANFASVHAYHRISYIYITAELFLAQQMLSVLRSVNNVAISPVCRSWEIMTRGTVIIDFR